MHVKDREQINREGINVDIPGERADGTGFGRCGAELLVETHEGGP